MKRSVVLLACLVGLSGCVSDYDDGYIDGPYPARPAYRPYVYDRDVVVYDRGPLYVDRGPIRPYGYRDRGGYRDRYDRDRGRYDRPYRARPIVVDRPRYDRPYRDRGRYDRADRRLPVAIPPRVGRTPDPSPGLREGRERRRAGEQPRLRYPFGTGAY